MIPRQPSPRPRSGRRRWRIAGATVLAASLAAAPIVSAAESVSVSTPETPTLLALAPAVFAISLAIIFRLTIPALFVGIALGAWLLAGGGAAALFPAILDSFAVHVVEAIAADDHPAIIAFTAMIGGMIGILRENGGLAGIVSRLGRWASSPRRVQLTTAGLGFGIFFDDYANVLLIGPTMRPLADRQRISRAKLAYIVDSTAAPVAMLALVSTWVGYQTSLIDTAIAGAEGLPSAYAIFAASIPYSFYPILAIVFVALVAGTGRDFGPMARAEALARAEAAAAAEPPERAGAEQMAPAPGRARDALVPISALIASVAGGLYASGEGDTLAEIIGSANAFSALSGAALIGVLVAGAMSIASRHLDLQGVMAAWLKGVEVMALPLAILILAWAIASVTSKLGAAEYLVALLADGTPASIVPAAVFVISAATAFATGASWGVMAIMMPLAVPLALALIAPSGVTAATDLSLLYATVAAVLAGAVWGDHCSPIADTTVMSSLATGCDHIEHVRTQAPYALLVGMVAIVFGALPAGFGVSPLICLTGGAATLAAAIFLLGRPLAAAGRASEGQVLQPDFPSP